MGVLLALLISILSTSNSRCEYGYDFYYSAQMDANNYKLCSLGVTDHYATKFINGRPYTLAICYGDTLDVAFDDIKLVYHHRSLSQTTILKVKCN